MIEFTSHSIDRARSRLGLSRLSLARLAQRAFHGGITHQDKSACGDLNRYLRAVCRSDTPANNLRVYGEHLFLFKDAVLLTVYELPAELKRKLNKNKEKNQ